MRQRARGNRGVAVVEAAIVTPVFFALILGICEISLAMNDYLAVSTAVRSGAREASTDGTDLQSDYLVLQAIARAGNAISRAKITRIVIYKATAYGDLPTTQCRGGTPVTGTCNVYTSSDMSRPSTDFGCISTKNLDRYWCPSSRKDTLTSGGTDYVGVWMSYTHTWLTKMFGNTLTLSDSSVIRLEPRTST